MSYYQTMLVFKSYLNDLIKQKTETVERFEKLYGPNAFDGGYLEALKDVVGMLNEVNEVYGEDSEW